jgi:2-dehydro-3-deoxyphosphogluconate aldolase/(4S)-4-hydroxy-2-oxoglutarate aldolase
MARQTRLSVLNTISEQRILPLFFSAEVDTAIAAAKACANAGGKLFEFTHRGEGALAVFAELEKWGRTEAPDLMLGAGSLVEPYTAAAYVNAGAAFIVGPALNAEIAKLCNRRKVAYIPGCGTVTEISNAEELGCEFVKVFPAAELGGPSFVKAVRGPLPWVSLIATGGVEIDEKSLKEWFAAGVSAVGLGSSLFSPDLVKAKKWGEIEKRMKRALSIAARL